MKSYTVHAPANLDGDLLANAEKFVFVRDGFSIFAFLLAPVWMLFNRLWLVLLGYLVLQAGVQLAFAGLGVSPSMQAALGLGINLLVAFEADSLRRWSMARKGYRLLGAVTGPSLEICERRFFESSWVDEGGTGAHSRPADEEQPEKAAPTSVPPVGDADSASVAPARPSSWASVSPWQGR